MKTIIIGAGAVGLLAAIKFPHAEIIEAAAELPHNHHAVLRFRNTDVSNLTGIKFKKVTVEKGIFRDGVITNHATILDLNQYAIKCTGTVGASRSIKSLSSETRYIAPDDFIEQLANKVGKSRIQFGKSFDFSACTSERPQRVISTAPLGVVLNQLNISIEQSSEINRHVTVWVRRIKLSSCRGCYQTIYFPEPGMVTYRASITDDTLIVESTVIPASDAEVCAVAAAFGVYLYLGDLSQDDDSFKQPSGKMTGLDSDVRRAILFELTNKYGIYSVGRLATFRHVLLDDVVNDLEVIRQLMEADSYLRSKTFSSHMGQLP